jgi:hypothetical protein
LFLLLPDAAARAPRLGNAEGRPELPSLDEPPPPDTGRRDDAALARQLIVTKKTVLIKEITCCQPVKKTAVDLHIFLFAY